VTEATTNALSQLRRATNDRPLSENQATVCVSAVLAHLGIPESAYRWTWNARTRSNVYEGVVRRHGYGVRSRKSRIPRGASVGGARKAIAAIKGDPPGTMYAVEVAGHLLLLNGKGETVIDTDPRKRDHRKVRKLYAILPK
jgi:hypothetical protein